MLALGLAFKANDAGLLAGAGASTTGAVGAAGVAGSSVAASGCSQLNKDSFISS